MFGLLLTFAAVAVPPVPIAPLATFVTSADMSALGGGQEGRVAFTLAVGVHGRVTGCIITRSSGHSLLDANTCRLMVRRARFAPARDSAGTPITGSLSGEIDWRKP